MSNKPFDLEKALAGEPVKLRNGLKTYIKYVMPEQYKGDYPLRGFLLNLKDDISETAWTMQGIHSIFEQNTKLDVIGMWQEPRPRVQLDLPTPLETVKKGQEVYYLELGNQFGQISKFNFNEDNPCAFQLYKNGGLFATKEDAKEWLEAMRNARR